MASKKTLLLATGIGSGLMYLLDPNGGKRRRAIAADKLAHAGRKTGNVAGKTVRDLRNRTKGLVAKTRSRFSRTEVPDEVLHDQIRSRLG
ncbi:MAG: SRPBCC family protein, partial [Vicinamibacteria bacterium]